MKAKKKLPIFLDIIKSSFLIIILILTIYTIVQTIIFGLFSSKYEAGQLFDTYRELSSIATDVGQGVSQEIFYEQITNLESRQNEEYIRIFQNFVEFHIVFYWACFTCFNLSIILKGLDI